MTRRSAKTELSVPEAALLVRKSTATVYRWIRDGRLQAEDTTDGPIVRTADLLVAASKVKPGRPRGE